MKRLPPAFLVAGVALLSTVIARVADSLLEAQALAGIMVSAVAIDLIVTRVGGELPGDAPFLERLRRAAPSVVPGLVAVLSVVGLSLALGHGRIAGATFDPASFALGVARAFGSVARRQLPFVVLPLALLGGRVDPRAIVVFGGLASAAAALGSGVSALSVLVHLAAGLLGAAAIVRSREFLAGLLAEGTVYLLVGTVFTSVVDLRLGAWALSPLERATGPYALGLALALSAAAAWLLWRQRPTSPAKDGLRSR